MGYPSNYRYTKEHEWVAANGKTAKIGISDFAQQQLGDIVFVELPAVGAELKAGESLGTVESVKAVSEVFAPVGGKVIAVNEKLAKAPELINQDPHGAAWMVEIEMSNSGDAGKLMDGAAYEKFVAAAEASH